MKILITNAIVCDPQSVFNSKKCDLLINNGIIEDIQISSKKAFGSGSKMFDAEGAIISPGWFDMRAALREPGFEFQETLETASNAAVAGGFTSIACLPSTQPSLQTKADIEFVYRKSESLPVCIFPYGALTKDRKGTDMNELYDMYKAGAIGFTDANKPVSHAGIMLRALQYTKNFNGLLLAHAEDEAIAAGGKMHEGEVSVNLGLKGIPAIVEEVMIARDIELANYAETGIHFSHISSKGSVELIRKAKKQGVKVTCDVAVANLVFTDDALSGFDSNYKLTPPLRDKSHQKALWTGLIDGTIDCIVSDHHPADIEHKNVEFEYATQGIIQLQTAFSLLNEYAPKNFNTDTLINALSVNPRKILRRPALSIAKGNRAELTLFDKEKSWTYTASNNKSKSKNSPLIGKTLRGKVIGILNKNQFIKNHD